MNRWIALAAALLGCHEASHDVHDALDAAPPGEGPFDVPGSPAAPAPPPLPVVMALESDPWVPGETALLTATGAIPGAKVFFVRGGAVGSSCFAKLGGDCIDLDRPSVLGSAIADAGGDAVFSTVVDATLAIGADIHLQAVVAAGAPYASEVLSLTATAATSDALTLFVDAARLTRKDPATDTKWDFDPLFGLFEDPDAYVGVFVDGAFVGGTRVDDDTRDPMWAERFELTVSDDAVVEIVLWDADTQLQGADDWVDTLVFTGAELHDEADAGPFSVVGGWGVERLDLGFI